MSRPGTVKIQFALPDSDLDGKVIEVASTSEYDANYVSDFARDSNLSFEYSGRHDHSNLPKLHSSGPMALLISSLYDTKKQCDTLLTEVINKQNADIENVEKKPRIDNSDDDIEDV